MKNRILIASFFATVVAGSVNWAGAQPVQKQNSTTSVYFKHERTGLNQPNNKVMTFRVYYDHKYKLTIPDQGILNIQVRLSGEENIERFETRLDGEEDWARVKGKSRSKVKIGSDSTIETVAIQSLPPGSVFEFAYTIRSSNIKVLRNFCNEPGENTIRIAVPEFFKYNVFAPSEFNMKIERGVTEIMKLKLSAAYGLDAPGVETVPVPKGANPSHPWITEPRQVNSQIYVLTAPKVTEKTCALFTLEDISFGSLMALGTDRETLLKTK